MQIELKLVAFVGATIFSHKSANKNRNNVLYFIFGALRQTLANSIRSFVKFILLLIASNMGNWICVKTYCRLRRRISLWIYGSVSHY